MVVGTHSDDPSCTKKVVTEMLDKMTKRHKELFPKLELHYYAVNCLKVDSENIKKVRKQVHTLLADFNDK